MIACKNKRPHPTLSAGRGVADALGGAAQSIKKTPAVRPGVES